MSCKNIRYGGNSLIIKKFDIKSMPDYVTIAMIAKRASGKSYLTREIPKLFKEKQIQVPDVTIGWRDLKTRHFVPNLGPPTF